jgi:hypothetical protein
MFRTINSPYNSTNTEIFIHPPNEIVSDNMLSTNNFFEISINFFKKGFWGF